MMLFCWLAVYTTPATFKPPYAVLDFEDFAGLIRETAARPHVKNYSAWALNNIPLLDFPDPDVQTTYYYRWRLFREHIETIGGLTLIDEFLPGAGGHPIPCAAGHHFAEGMWLRDASVLDDIAAYWFERAGDLIYSYTHWIGSSALRRQTLRGDAQSGAKLLDRLLLAWKGGRSAAGGGSYEGYARKYLDNAGKCWWQVDDRDGMEFGTSVWSRLMMLFFFCNVLLQYLVADDSSPSNKSSRTLIMNKQIKKKIK